MVSEPVNDKLVQANEIIDEMVKIGNKPDVLGLCFACDGILDNIKIFVQGHHKEAWEKIAEKEKELNTMFMEQFKKDSEKINAKGEYFKFLAQQSVEAKNMIWKCKQKLGFYEWLTKKYDI